MSLILRDLALTILSIVSDFCKRIVRAKARFCASDLLFVAGVCRDRALQAAAALIEQPRCDTHIVNQAPCFVAVIRHAHAA